MKLINTFLALLILSFGSQSDLCAKEDKDIAVVLKARGLVELKQDRGWTRARGGHRLDSGQVVKTGEKSLATLVFTDDKTQLKIRSNTQLTVKGQRKKHGILKRLSLGFGEIWAKVTKQKHEMRVETPSGVATVKGTEFNALFDSQSFIIFCQEGLMALSNLQGQMLLGTNEMGRMVQGSPPERLSGNPNDIFTLGDEDGSELQIDFEDEEGNSKSLIINLDGN